MHAWQLTPHAAVACARTQVAQQFTRQYYAVLNQQPHDLHNFYMQDSVLSIGGGPLEQRQANGKEVLAKGVQHVQSGITMLADHAGSVTATRSLAQMLQ